jgi:hydrogenase nickel incorporation protein HypB
MILSVPEGDDKPLKYPLMFSQVDLLLVNKIDAISLFDFDFEALEKRVRALNPKIHILHVSAKTGEGFREVCDWLQVQMEQWKQS